MCDVPILDAPKFKVFLKGTKESPLGCSSLTMMHASILSIWYVIKWHKIRPLQKK